MAVSEDDGSAGQDRQHDDDEMVKDAVASGGTTRGEIPFGGGTGSLAGLDGGGMVIEGAAHQTRSPAAAIPQATRWERTGT